MAASMDCLQSSIDRCYANLQSLEEGTIGFIVKNRWLKVPHRSDTHLKRNGHWVTKTILTEKRMEA